MARNGKTNIENYLCTIFLVVVAKKKIFIINIDTLNCVYIGYIIRQLVMSGGHLTSARNNIIFTWKLRLMYTNNVFRSAVTLQFIISSDFFFHSCGRTHTTKHVCVFECFELRK